MRVMSEVAAAGAVKVGLSASLSSGFDKRCVVIDEATGVMVDDACGFGYKSAQNAHRAHAYTSMPPRKKQRRGAAQRPLRRWCAAHPEFMGDIEQAMFYAVKDGRNVTEADVRALLAERGVELVFSVEDLMRHWNW